MFCRKYVYTVSDRLGLLACFTNKTKMIKYLRTLDTMDLHVLRWPDAQPDAIPFRYDVKELIASAIK